MRVAFTTLCCFLLSLSCSEGTTTPDWTALLGSGAGDPCGKPELTLYNFTTKALSCIDLTGGDGGDDNRTVEEKLSPSLDKSPYCCGYDGQQIFLKANEMPRKGVFTNMCTLSCQIKTCLEGRSTCDASWNAWFLENAPPTNLLHDIVCDGCNPKPDLQALEDDPAADPACLFSDPDYAPDVVTCQQPSYMADLTSKFLSPAPGAASPMPNINETLDDFIAILRQGVKCARDIPSTCNDSSKEYFARFYEIQMAYVISFFQSIVKVSETDVLDVLPMNLASPTRCSAGVTGDPHLFRDECEGAATFERETCSAAGKQLYLGNKFIQVQGTNTLLPGQPEKGATTLTDITVRFIWNGIEIGSLSAASGAAPNKLQKKAGGEEHIEVVSSGLQNIIIRHKPAGIWLEINVWEQNYFFTTRMSRDLFKESYGLLKGCPASQTIDIDSMLSVARRRRGTLGDCSGVNPDLIEACQYDCLIMNSDQCQSMTMGSTYSLTVAPQDDAALIASAISGAADTTTAAATTTETKTTRKSTVSQEGNTVSTTNGAATSHVLLPVSLSLLLLSFLAR